MKFKIAVVQLHIDINNAKKTFKKAEFYIRKASNRADIIVFPEYLVSWNFIDHNEVFKKRFQVLAKKYGIDIVTGSIVVKQKNGLFNTTYYISSDGKVRGVYRKVNLWHPERRQLSAGKDTCVFNTKFGKIGLAICWDLAFPELHRKMARKGAKIVICPAFWSNQDVTTAGLKYYPKAEQRFIDACCAARAFENELIFVFCNFADMWMDGKIRCVSSGHSQIAVPLKGVIRKIEHNREAMFIQEVDTAIVDDAEKAYRIRKDLKTRLY